MTTELRKQAMALYTPPFKYQDGYVMDSEHRMVADDGDIEGNMNVAARVRGWGRISYLENAAALQDEVGHMMADALNALYVKEEQ